MITIHQIFRNAFGEELELRAEITGDYRDEIDDIQRFLSVSTRISYEINNQIDRCNNKTSEVITA